MPICSDNTGALTVAGNTTYLSRTKHIALRFIFIQELVKEGKITLHFVPTGKILVGCGTKHLEKSSPGASSNKYRNFPKTNSPSTGL